jgi:hypothetical protein
MSMENKNTENETNGEGEDKLSKSVTDKNPDNAQSVESDSEFASTDSSISPMNTEKTAKKSSSVVRVEDYDLIANSLKDATASFKDIIFSISKKAQGIRERAEETLTVGAKRDAREIHALGGQLENVVKGFEDTMNEIKKSNYNDEEKLLKGYKRLLLEQINLINARMELVKRLKSGNYKNI